MSAPETACETCGRQTTGRDGCRAHPGARLLDLTDPEDAAWAVSLRDVVRQRRRRALSLAGVVGIAGLFAVVLLAGIGENDGLAVLGRDASVEAMIVLCSLVAAVAVVLGRIGGDAFRALTGRDTTPDAFALRKARGLRAVLSAVGAMLTWGAVHAALELAGGGLGAVGWAILALGPVGLALIVGAARMRMPETPDAPTPLPVVDDAEPADRARAKAAREQVRARHRPPVHIKTHGG